MKMWLVFAAALAGAVAWSSAALADEVKVASIEAFLVYGQSGRLSPDIAGGNATIDFHNTVIGEGGAEEPADDVLVVVHFIRGATGGETPEISLRAVAHDSGNAIQERKNLTLAFVDGATAARSMLLADVTCTDVDVTVSVGKAQTGVNLPFTCGE